MIRDDYTSTHHARLVLWRPAGSSRTSTRRTAPSSNGAAIDAPDAGADRNARSRSARRRSSCGGNRRDAIDHERRRLPRGRIRAQQPGLRLRGQRISSSSPTAWAATRAATSPRRSRSAASARPTATSRSPQDAEFALQSSLIAANQLHQPRPCSSTAELTGMGTTVSAMMRVGDSIAIAHIGDSRIYLYRDGELSQITNDHTFVQRLVDTGRITPEEAAVHPRRTVLMRVLGDVDAAPEIDTAILGTQPGDRWLLCSDGLSSYVAEERIRKALGLRTSTPSRGRSAWSRRRSTTAPPTTSPSSSSTSTRATARRADRAHHRRLGRRAAHLRGAGRADARCASPRSCCTRSRSPPTPEDSTSSPSPTSTSPSSSPRTAAARAAAASPGSSRSSSRSCIVARRRLLDVPLDAGPLLRRRTGRHGRHLQGRAAERSARSRCRASTRRRQSRSPTLSNYNRQNVDETINAGSLDDARAIVERLARCQQPVTCSRRRHRGASASPPNPRRHRRAATCTQTITIRLRQPARLRNIELVLLVLACGICAARDGARAARRPRRASRPSCSGRRSASCVLALVHARRAARRRPRGRPVHPADRARPSTASASPRSTASTSPRRHVRLGRHAASTADRLDDRSPWSSRSPCCSLIRNHRVLRATATSRCSSRSCCCSCRCVPGLGRERRSTPASGSTSARSRSSPARSRRSRSRSSSPATSCSARDSLSLVGPKILGMRFPRPRDLGPILVVWAVAMLVLIFERDLGTSLLYFGLFLVMIYVATGKAQLGRRSASCCSSAAPSSRRRRSATCTAASTPGSTRSTELSLQRVRRQLPARDRVSSASPTAA